MGKTILVLGGGVGGLVAARELRSRLGREHRIILADRTGQHVFWPSLLWVMTGDRAPSAIVRDLDPLARRGIEVRRAEVAAIDPARRAVRLDGAEVVADYLVLALGADLAMDAVPGLGQAAHEFYSVAGAERLAAALREFRDGRIVLVVPSLPYKCPGAPCEAALLLESHFRRRRVDAEVTMYTPEPMPLPVIGGPVSEAVLAVLRGRGIAYHAEQTLARVEAEARQLVFADGRTAPYDLLVAIPPLRPPGVVREAGLLGEKGWIPADRVTLATRHPGVYAVGDTVGIMLAHGKPLPKAGVFAKRQAVTVAANIAAEINGLGGRTAFDGWGACFLETGDGRAGYGSGNFYAEPAPEVRLRPPSRWWHWGKVAWEKYWLWKWL
ncbi:MAG: NAD(P)/FAD-dependent oxidoreductase [Gemmatimonadetes bacterium]|nr:NAD(P)/FAD-dependent oxidoreductase [Gemmatimonadota bacterium]